MTTIPSTEVCPEEAPGRRERKKLATRQALHRAAVELVEERGLANVTVEAITERADVAVRTFFNYFPSKEEAVLERDPDRTARLCQALADRPAGEEPLTALRQVILHDLLGRDLDSGELLRRMRMIAAEPTLAVLMARNFEEMHMAAATQIARRLGLDAPDAYVDLLVAAAFAACRVSLYRWCKTGGTGDATTIVNDAFDTLASGFTPPAVASSVSPPRPTPTRPEAPRP
jgi:AcrR family transcriptional regulator